VEPSQRVVEVESLKNLLYAEACQTAAKALVEMQLRFILATELHSPQSAPERNRFREPEPHTEHPFPNMSEQYWIVVMSCGQVGAPADCKLVVQTLLMLDEESAECKALLAELIAKRMLGSTYDRICEWSVSDCILPNVSDNLV
jgi:hypothetical protein